ncbi:hypothetical protein [Arthrobacter sp.]|uniref:hypothetical protein n=1 Tax=Arthrobacter sp. TaxID=1667 RepID=UPI003A8D6A31
MTTNHSDEFLAKPDAADPDRVSDPALSDEVGHDWTDEGGATPTGAATNDSPTGKG